MNLCPTNSTRSYAYTLTAPPSLTAPYLSMPLRPVEDSEGGRGYTRKLGVETSSACSRSRNEGTVGRAGGTNTLVGGLGGSSPPPPPFNLDIAAIVSAAVNAACSSSRHEGTGGDTGGTNTLVGGLGGSSPPPFNVDIAAIVTAAVKAATQLITTAAVAAAASNASTRVRAAQAPLSQLKLLHLRMICGVATNDGIPSIWREVAAAPNKQSGLAILRQYLMKDMRSCRRTYLGHPEWLHCSIPLYNFVAGDRFVNPGENPACPAGGMSMWTTLQGTDDVGEQMASVDADLTALDGRNMQADQVAQAAKVHLQPIYGATNLQREIGTKTYILAKLFGESCPLVKGYTSVVTWIDENFTSFEQQVATTSSCTSFAYDLSRTEAAYYNACIRASTTILLGDPGRHTPVSFTMLLDELTWGRYRGQPLPVSLQTLLLPSSTPPTTPSQPQSTPPDTDGTPPGSNLTNTPSLGRGLGRPGFDSLCRSHNRAAAAVATTGDGS